MTDPSVRDFFAKNANEDYLHSYDVQHGPRLDAMLQHWNLRAHCAGKRVLDVGGGLGFLGKRLDPSTDYTVIDGATIAPTDRLCHGRWTTYDLDRHSFGSEDGDNGLNRTNSYPWDVAFCLETLEHLTNPYNCLAEMKKLVKEDGDIFLSIPHANVTHNYIYPALMVDPQNFQQFLGQMALPVKDYWLWNKGWNSHTFWCNNRSWTHARMLYPKAEPKFYGKTPVEYVNL